MIFQPGHRGMCAVLPFFLRRSVVLFLEEGCLFLRALLGLDAPASIIRLSLYCKVSKVLHFAQRCRVNSGVLTACLDLQVLQSQYLPLCSSQDLGTTYHSSVTHCILVGRKLQQLLCITLRERVSPSSFANFTTKNIIILTNLEVLEIRSAIQV